MAPVLNCSHYQVVIGGMAIDVSDLTEEQAKQQLCRIIELMEEIQSSAFSVNEKIESWRVG